MKDIVSSRVAQDRKIDILITLIAMNTAAGTKKLTGCSFINLEINIIEFFGFMYLSPTRHGGKSEKNNMLLNN